MYGSITIGLFLSFIMMWGSKKIYFCCILFVGLCHGIAWCQPSFTATISPRTIGKDETAELRLMVENAQQVDEIIPPSLKNFIIVSGPNQESGMQSANGVTRQYIGITFLLQPKEKGSYTIAGAIAKADGKTLKSNPVTLSVTNSASAGNRGNMPSPFAGISPFADRVEQSSYKDYILKKGENVQEKINKNMFIKVDVSKHSCYVGEPVVVTYKLYTRLKSESSILKNPSFNGFSVIDLIQPGSTYSIEKLNGREYNVYSLRKSQLYPLQAGTLELETAEVDNNIHFIREEYLNRQTDIMDDMFRDFSQTTIPAEGMHDEKVTLQNKPVFITVNPLPEKDKPALFKGAVGDFSISADVEKNNFTTDDAGKLRLSITGEGNMTLVNAPDIEWPAGVEGFEPVSKEQLNKLNVPVSGVKYFEYPFTVTSAGRYTLPAVTFCFFNVKEGRYKTVSTNPILINVKKGVSKRATIVSNSNEVKGNEQFFEMIFTNRWMIITPVALLIMGGLFFWLLKDKKSASIAVPVVKAPADEIRVTKEVQAISFSPLSSTEEKLSQPDSHGFYETLNREMRKFLADKFSIPLSTINKKSIAEEADKKGIDVNTCLQIQQLLDDIEWQLYTPYVDEDKIRDMYNRADAIVHSLNAAIR